MMTDEFLTFLAYSTELEQESQERYLEIAESMEAHRNDEVARFFHRMSDEAGSHLAEVSLLCEGAELPQIKAWEFNWPGAEPPETTSYEALHYRMSLHDAMTLALANERAAEQFYRDYALNSKDAEVISTAKDFADEENSHAQALELMLEEVPVVSELAREEDDPPTMPE
ncbi:ferritin family protein [Congregibacter variabilis]|uniref:Ferritin family protein n=1 Tax=Congregibacter variabilis TaxID=3081200 RepID=A0ABZ0HZ70_9GAMM|nr:ferritin family protein [Congregibacter sp. IMCC43200]